jgi:hypothetical protein
MLAAMAENEVLKSTPSPAKATALNANNPMYNARNPTTLRMTSSGTVLPPIFIGETARG